MEPQKMRKCLKLLTLLISSILIATASAATYNMFMNASVGVGTLKGMSFVLRDPDYGTCGGTFEDLNQKVSFSTMNGDPGVETVYRPVDITNTDVGGHNIELVLDTWDGADQANLYSITISMYDSTETQQGVSIILYPDSQGTSVETSGSVPIGVETWQVEWKVYWMATADPLLDSVQVALLLVVS